MIKRNNIISYRDLLGALDDAQNDLSKISLMFHMALDNDANINTDDAENLAGINSIQKEIKKFATSKFNKYLLREIDGINFNLKNKMLTFKDQKVILCNEHVLLDIDINSYKEAFDIFNASKNDIIDKADKAMKTIIANKKKIKLLSEELHRELKNKPFIINKSSVNVKITDSILSMSAKHLVNLEASYMQRETAKLTINLLSDIDKNLMEDMKKVLIEGLKMRIATDRTNSIKKAIAQLCTELKIKDIYFENFEKRTEKPWDFEKGYISFDLDLSNKQLAKNFSKDLISSVKAIESLYLSKVDYIMPNRNIILSKNYYYKFKFVRNHNGEDYAIYEGRIGTRKPLLFIVKDNQRIFGHLRTKLLREMNLNKSN